MYRNMVCYKTRSFSKFTWYCQRDGKKFRRKLNKRRSRTAIFSVKEAQKRLLEQTTNDSHNDTHFWQKRDVDGDLAVTIQDGSFRKLCIRKPRKQRLYFNFFFATSATSDILGKMSEILQSQSHQQAQNSQKNTLMKNQILKTMILSFKICLHK